MDPIKVDSDSWTGLDPSRKAPRGILPSTRRKMAKFLFAIGGLGLFLLGYTFATFDEWFQLAVPAVVAMQGFVLGAREWRLSQCEAR